MDYVLCIQQMRERAACWGVAGVGVRLGWIMDMMAGYEISQQRY